MVNFFFLSPFARLSQEQVFIIWFYKDDMLPFLVGYINII
jgi:hypothetical protein